MSEGIEGVIGPEAQIQELKQKYWSIYNEDHKKLLSEYDSGKISSEDKSRYEEEAGELTNIAIKVAEIARENNLPLDPNWVLWKNRQII